MRVLFDFSGMEACRSRDVRKMALFATIAGRLGAEVHVRDSTNTLTDRLEGFPWVMNFPRSDNADGFDLYLPSCDAVHRKKTAEHTGKTAVLSHRIFEPKIEAKLVDEAVPWFAVKHNFRGPNVRFLSHIVSDAVLRDVEREGLLEAYMDDDLAAIRARYAPAGEKRIAGFIGVGLYGRDEAAKVLPPWCQVLLFEPGTMLLSPGDYLRWLSGCLVAIDLPGQHPRTYRFAEAAMLGVPVLCVEPVGCQPDCPINTSNSVALRSMSDYGRLRRLMDELPEIRRTADRCYVEAWSPRAQVRSILEEGDRWARPVVTSEPQKPEPEPEVVVTRPVEPLPLPPPCPSLPGSPKVLIVYDVEGWAYHRRASALHRLAPEWLSVDMADWDERDWGEYQLVYLLDYAKWSEARKRIEACGDERPLFVVSFNADANRRQSWWDNVTKAADWVVSVNRSRFLARGAAENCCLISNGYDELVFRPSIPIEHRPHRCLWCGSASGKGEKGYHEIILPLKDLAEKEGFECDFRLLRSRDEWYAPDKQALWYNSGSYILSASASEGTANTITEGVACGCVAVSTPVGNIEEWGVDRRNCLISKRNQYAFRDALLYARANRSRLSRAGLNEMASWSYDRRAPYYYALFRRLIQDGPGSVRPFVYSDTPLEAI